MRGGRGRGRLAAAGKVKVVVKLTKKAKRGVRHAKKSVKARIRTTATGAGGKTVVTKKITLKR